MITFINFTVFCFYYILTCGKIQVQYAEERISEMSQISNAIIAFIEQMYQLLWGDLVVVPLPGGSTLGLSILVMILIPSGIYFTF